MARTTVHLEIILRLKKKKIERLHTDKTTCNVKFENFTNVMILSLDSHSFKDDNPKLAVNGIS